MLDHDKRFTPAYSIPAIIIEGYDHKGDLTTISGRKSLLHGFASRIERLADYAATKRHADLPALLLDIAQTIRERSDDIATASAGSLLIARIAGSLRKIEQNLFGHEEGFRLSE